MSNKRPGRAVRIRRNLLESTDPYLPRLDPGEVAACSECHALYQRRHWFFDADAYHRVLVSLRTPTTVLAATLAPRSRAWSEPAQDSAWRKATSFVGQGICHVWTGYDHLVFLLLLLSLRAVGVTASEVSWVEAFAAWALVRIIGTIPITPGGIGVVELSLTGTLVGFGGNNAGVVAAVLVFRFLTTVPTLILGLTAAFTWRRQGLRTAEAPEPPPESLPAQAPRSEG